MPPKRKSSRSVRRPSSSLQSCLLSWFATNQRPLPWRKPIVADFALTPQYKKLYKEYEVKSSKDRDVKKDSALLSKLHEKIPAATPYSIWVSEIMSQQTRIDVVVPFWQRWMLRFPDSTALAEAPFDEVQKYWSGLGFYRRCEFLHRGAKSLQQQQQPAQNDDSGNQNNSAVIGALPTDSVESLKKIPGIGDYTAAAIGSIAFNHRDCPAVDGNVLRVTSRLFGLKNINVKEKKHILKLSGLAKELMNGVEVAGDWNQAMMELGATICRPNGEPLCENCPVAKFCFANKMKNELGDIEEINGVIPLKSEAMQKQTVKALICVIYCSEEKQSKAGDDDDDDLKVLIFKRESSGEKDKRKLLSGFWSFPMISLAQNVVNKNDNSQVKPEKYTAKKVGQLFSVGMKKQEGASKAEKSSTKLSQNGCNNASTSFNLVNSYSAVSQILSKENKHGSVTFSVCDKDVHHIFSHIDFTATVCKIRVSSEKDLSSLLVGNYGSSRIVSLSQLREHDHVAISNLDEKIAAIAFPKQNRRRQRE